MADQTNAITISLSGITGGFAFGGPTTARSWLKDVCGLNWMIDSTMGEVRAFEATMTQIEDLSFVFEELTTLYDSVGTLNKRFNEIRDEYGARYIPTEYITRCAKMNQKFEEVRDKFLKEEAPKRLNIEDAINAQVKRERE